MFLLSVMTTLVFIRPADLYPEMFKDVSIFKWIALPALLIVLKFIPERTNQEALRRQPILLCFLGFFFAIVFSGVTHFSFWFARQGFMNFAVVAVYFLVAATVIDTPARLLTFLRVIVIAAITFIVLVMIDYLDFMAIMPIDKDTQLSVTKLLQVNGYRSDGEWNIISRMRGIGIFKDPNDLSQVVVACSFICLYFSRLTKSGSGRYLWVLPVIFILLPALMLTKSRGGLLAAGVGGMTILAVHYGRRAVIGGAIAGLLALVVVGGRQASMSVSSGTGHSRLLLWRDGFVAVQGKDLLFGIGYSLYEDIARLQAHNSYVHAFIETGLFGGTLFFGCFFFSIMSLTRMKQAGISHLDERLRQFHPFCCAIVMAWCVGMTSLSRNYVIPTYQILAIAFCYVSMCEPKLKPPQLLAYWDRRHIGSLVKGSALCFLLFYGMVRVFAR